MLPGMILAVVLTVGWLLVLAGWFLHDYLEQVRHERELDARIAARRRHPSRRSYR